MSLSSAGWESVGTLATFPLENLIDNSMTDFDVYLQVRGNTVLYGTTGYRWYREEVQRLMRSGFQSFMIKEADQSKALMYKQLAQLPLLKKNQAPAERLVSIEQIGAAFLKAVHEGQLTSAAVDHAKRFSTDLVECLLEQPKCIQALRDLAEHDYYTYFHSVRVAMFTVSIAMQMGLKDKAKLEEIALGAVFHDVGKKLVPIEVIDKTGALTDHEWKAMRAHPVKGLELIGDHLFAHVPREIIVHHHEKLDGSGYPDGLQGSSLLVEVQIATLADVYDALTSVRSYQQPRTRFEALDFIKKKMLGTKLGTEPFKALIASLAT